MSRRPGGVPSMPGQAGQDFNPDCRNPRKDDDIKSAAEPALLLSYEF